MPGRIAGRVSCRMWLPPLACAVAALFGAVAAAQTAAPDEAVDARGAIAPPLALTQAQKSAIYDAVSQQRVRASTAKIPLAVGAPVPPSAALSDLPIEILSEQAAGENILVLKYAMVEDEVVVVDPIHMRVVDVIHRGAQSGAVP
jgi:hypothetical protein